MKSSGVSLNFCPSCSELLNAISSNSVNSSGISAINNLYGVGVNLSGLSLVTTRSERYSNDSCEHKY